MRAQWFMWPVLVPSRVNDSDDLIMTESEVGKIALHIEKEMFNLFQVTDNRYKSKYRSIMFNLKDPKNQVCAGGPERGLPALGVSQAHLTAFIWTRHLEVLVLAVQARGPPSHLPWARGAGSHTLSQARPGLTSCFSPKHGCEVTFVTFHWLQSNIQILKRMSISVFGLQTAFSAFLPSPQLSEPADRGFLRATISGLEHALWCSPLGQVLCARMVGGPESSQQPWVGSARPVGLKGEFLGKH